MKGRYLSQLSSNDPLYDYIQGHIAPQLGVHLFAVINDAISQSNPNRLYRLTSRSDPPRARLISCAVAALVSHRME
jgi:hypothetical protein